MDKQAEFKAKLDDLLKEYNATITIADYGSGFVNDLKVVVEFDYKEGNGFVKDLVLGSSYFA